jgi:hypothetical protein
MRKRLFLIISIVLCFTAVWAQEWVGFAKTEPAIPEIEKAEKQKSRKAEKQKSRKAEKQKSRKAESGESSYALTLLRSYGLEIYPNPGKDYITVASNVESCSFELIDATGTIVKSVKLQQGNNTINTSSLKQGIYIYRATTDDKVVSGKWIKQ